MNRVDEAKACLGTHPLCQHDSDCTEYALYWTEVVGSTLGEVLLCKPHWKACLETYAQVHWGPKRPDAWGVPQVPDPS